MLATLISGLAVVALSTVGVNAGNRAWESNIKYARAVHHEALQVRDVGLESYGNASDVVKSRSTGTLDSALPNAQYHFHNGSAQSVHKRWFGIDPDLDSLAKLWPQGNIKVCFEQAMWGSKSTEDILRGPLEEARGLWRDKGLDDNNGWFKWDVVDDKTWCSDRHNRPDFLLVLYAGPNVANMATSAGKGPRLNTDNPDNTYEKLGPRMVLSDVLTMGHRNIVANYAHEMGHAWGFHHEHQNPDWWAEAWSGEKRDSFFFGKDSFFCERLSDYADAVARIDAAQGYSASGKEEEKSKLCTSRTTAMHWQFTGGLNWLPVLRGVQWDKKKEPDWASLMIYPSTAGNGNAGTGKDTAIMLKKPNGDVIQPVLKPSSLDIEGLRKMYSAPQKHTGGLLNKKGSAFFNKFKFVKAKDPDAGCS